MCLWGNRGRGGRLVYGYRPAEQIGGVVLVCDAQIYELDFGGPRGFNVY